MRRNRKADAGHIGSKPNLNKHSRHRFSVGHYTPEAFPIQCRKCRSDYMRFAFDGYCQRCQQRVEYIRRERLLERRRAA